MSLHELNFKTNDLVLLFKTIWMYWSCFLSPVATDGMDGNGLKLEKKIANFFKFWCYVFQKSSRNLLWIAISDKIHLISSSQLYRSILFMIKASRKWFYRHAFSMSVITEVIVHNFMKSMSWWLDCKGLNVLSSSVI